MTARKPKYTGPEVVPASTSDEYVWIRPPGMPDWQRGIMLRKSEIPDFVARLQKFAPQPEPDARLHANLPLPPREEIYRVAMDRADEIAGRQTPKRKAKAKPDRYASESWLADAMYPPPKPKRKKGAK